MPGLRAQGAVPCRAADVEGVDRKVESDSEVGARKARRLMPRIVHDIEGEDVQVSMGGEPYNTVPGKTPHTWKVRGIAVVIPHGWYAHAAVPEGEALHIEGNASLILRMLKDAVEQIEDIGDLFAKEGRIPPDWRNDPSLHKRLPAKET